MRQAAALGDAHAYYYVNKVTGEAQWDRPLFTLGPPRLADFAVAHGPENDPSTWIKVAGGWGCLPPPPRHTHARAHAAPPP